MAGGGKTQMKAGQPFRDLDGQLRRATKDCCSCMSLNWHVAACIFKTWVDCLYGSTSVHRWLWFVFIKSLCVWKWLLILRSTKEEALGWTSSSPLEAKLPVSVWGQAWQDAVATYEGPICICYWWLISFRKVGESPKTSEAEVFSMGCRPSRESDQAVHGMSGTWAFDSGGLHATDYIYKARGLCKTVLQCTTVYKGFVPGQILAYTSHR